MKCENCGHKNLDDAKFCSHCGSDKLYKTTFCTNCGFENLEKTKFCPNCGSPLNNKSNIQTEDTIEETKTETTEEETQPVKTEPQEEQTETTKKETQPEETETAEEQTETTKTETLPVKIETQEKQQAENNESTNIVNTNQIITKQMTDAFNMQHRSPTSISNQEKPKVKIEYFKHISKNPDVHDKMYDPKLVEVKDNGTIKDRNHAATILLDFAKYWGAAFIVFLLLMGLGSLGTVFGTRGVFGFIAFILIFIFGGLILLFTILNIACFMEIATSSRDSTHKLISSIHILPIILLLIASLLTIGVYGTILLIIAFLFVGGIGLACIMGK